MLRSRFLRCFALIASVVASAACGDYAGSTGPVASGSAGLAPPTRTIAMAFAILPDDARARAVRWAPSHVGREQTVSAQIGPAGGSLSLPGADFEMTIPQGALEEATLISVSSLKGTHVAFDMQPHGLQFRKPVRVVQGLRNTATYGTPAGNGVRSAYLADAHEQIEDDDSVIPAELPAATTLFYEYVPIAQTHIWYLNHFSRYILISGVWVCVEGCTSTK